MSTKIQRIVEAAFVAAKYFDEVIEPSHAEVHSVIFNLPGLYIVSFLPVGGRRLYDVKVVVQFNSENTGLVRPDSDHVDEYPCKTFAVVVLTNLEVEFAPTL